MEQKTSIEIKNLVEKWKGKEGNLIMILHEIQNHHGYVPREISLELSKMLDVPLARIYEVITFYNFFKLKKPGRNLIQVCMGTACYLKGGQDLIDEAKSILGLSNSEITTIDGQFSVEPVRCIGCCGLAPVLSVNGDVFGKLTRDQMDGVLAKYK